MADENRDSQGMHTPPPTNGLLRLSAAARLAGLTPEAMRAALARNEIPITSIHLGKLTFVKAAELNQWLSSTPAPASANLFN